MPYSNPGRPRSLDKAKQGAIIGIVACGGSLKLASQFVGCAPCTLRREFLRNPQFADQLRDASRGFEVASLRAVMKAALHDPKALDWIRRHVCADFNLLKPPPAHVLALPPINLPSALFPAELCALSSPPESLLARVKAVSQRAIQTAHHKFHPTKIRPKQKTAPKKKPRNNRRR